MVYIFVFPNILANLGISYVSIQRPCLSEKYGEHIVVHLALKALSKVLHPEEAIILFVKSK